MAIFRFFKMAAAAMLDFEMANVRGYRSNRCRYIPILDLTRWQQPPSWIFKILNF